MKTPRPLVTIEVRPGVFVRIAPDKAAKFAPKKPEPVEVLSEDEPVAPKKKTPAKNKKAAQYDTKGE